MAVTETEVQAPAVPAHPELLKAASILRRDGWCQGQYRKGDKSCLVSAVYRATHYAEPWEDDNGYWGALYQATGSSMGLLSNWNDQPGRTQEEVIELLERVGWGI